MVDGRWEMGERREMRVGGGIIPLLYRTISINVRTRL